MGEAGRAIDDDHSTYSDWQKRDVFATDAVLPLFFI